MAEMSMVEKVARAIALEHLDPETRAAVDPNEWFVTESYLNLARAAIEAMRVTSGAMRSAGAEAARRHTSYFDNPTAQIVYEAMVDAALSEEVAG